MFDNLEKRKTLRQVGEIRAITVYLRYLMSAMGRYYNQVTLVRSMRASLFIGTREYTESSMRSLRLTR